MHLRDFRAVATLAVATVPAMTLWEQGRFQVVPAEKLFQIFMRQSIPSNHEVTYARFPIVYAGVH